MLKDEKTETTIDRATYTITFRRRLEANREDVFDAWTQPEQLRQWWDPTGAPLHDCTVDLRPGGSFVFTNEGHHGPPFAGVYRQVERPMLLVFDALGALGTVRLEEASGHTRMTVSIRCGSAEHLEQFLTIGVASGTELTLDNLCARLKRS